MSIFALNKAGASDTKLYLLRGKICISLEEIYFQHPQEIVSNIRFSSSTAKAAFLELYIHPKSCVRLVPVPHQTLNDGGNICGLDLSLCSIVAHLDMI